MRIDYLLARNLFKYAHLELRDLPEHGMCAVSGPNESGKTAIAEIICLALFGRTHRLDTSEVGASVSWGTPGSFVELAFTLEGERHYRINRTITADGEHSAELCPQANDQVIARGVTEVEAAIERLIGFGFEHYAGAMYLAQRARPFGRGIREDIQRVAGGERLEQLLADLRAESQTERADTDRLEEELSAIERDVGLLRGADSPGGADQVYAGDIERRISESGRLKDSLRNVLDELQSVSAEWRDAGARVLGCSAQTPIGEWRSVSKHLGDASARLGQLSRAMGRETPLACLGALQGAGEELDVALNEVSRRAEEMRAELAEQLGAGAPQRQEGGLSLQQRRERLRAHLSFLNRTGRFARINFLLMLLISVVAWCAWALLAQFPRAELAVDIAAWFERHVPFKPLYTAGLGVLAVMLSVICVVVLIRSLSVARRIAGADHELRTTERRLDIARQRLELVDYLEHMPFSQALEALDAVDDDSLIQTLAPFMTPATSSLVGRSSLAQFQRRFETALQQCSEETGDLREALAQEQGRATAEHALLTEQRSREPRPGALPVSDASSEKIRQSIIQLGGRIQRQQHRLKVLETARGLVHGALARLYRRLSRQVHHHARELLPRLTDGRYEHLEIDDDLSVLVMSPAKRSFVGLDELSGGTAEQVSLAVRLAMLLSLMESKELGTQFVVLDEPFAYFDAERASQTMEVLASLAPRLGQIWVMSQAFGADRDIALTIECDSAIDRLTVAAD